MKRLLFAGLLLAIASIFTAQAEVSVTIGQPGFYGNIDIGGYPAPQLIFPQPIIIAPAPAVPQPPIYLRVLPEQTKEWSKHCHHYNACNRSVYFVKDDWYEREYIPRYRERHENRIDKDDKHEGHYYKHDNKYYYKKKHHKGKHNKGKHHGHSKGKEHGHHGRGNKH